MSEIKSVCVYCSARDKVDESYKQAAQAAGEWLGKSGRDLIYGGSRSGLMGIIADAVLKNGGKATGIIPKHIQDVEIPHDELTEFHLVDTMHERKQMMIERADAFVALPGGFGTIEEFFEVLTWKQLGLHDHPIVLANINGHWDLIVETLDQLIEKKFAEESNKDLFRVVTSIDDIEEALLSQPRDRHPTHAEQV